MGLEQRGISEQTIINYEPDVYKRFSQPGIKYLLPLDPSHSQIALNEPRPFMRDTNLINTEHAHAKPISIYTLPEISDLENETHQDFLLEYICSAVHKLGETNDSYKRLEDMLTDENNYAYRAAKIRANELSANREPPQLNKLISIATYGLDYPPHNAGSNSAYVSISINNLPSAVHYLQNYSPFEPDLRAIYSLLLIYTSKGLTYKEEEVHKNIRGKRTPLDYGIKITDNETLRDKLQAVILVPFAQV